MLKTNTQQIVSGPWENCHRVKRPRICSYSPFDTYFAGEIKQFRAHLAEFRHNIFPVCQFRQTQRRRIVSASFNKIWHPEIFAELYKSDVIATCLTWIYYNIINKAYQTWGTILQKCVICNTVNGMNVTFKVFGDVFQFILNICVSSLC